MMGFGLGFAALLLVGGGAGFLVYELLRRRFATQPDRGRTPSTEADATFGVSHNKGYEHPGTGRTQAGFADRTGQSLKEKRADVLQKTPLRVLSQAAEGIEQVLPMTRSDGDTYRLLLARAGWNIQPETLRGVRVLVALGCAILFGATMATQTGLDFLPACLFVFVCAVCGWMIPRLVVERSILRRRSAMELQLPDAIELLGISVAAGSPVEQCFREVAQNLDQPLSAEFEAVNREVNLLGHSREQALENLAQRCASRDISAFVAQFSQAISQGSSIVEGLSAQATLARETAQAARMERIRKMSTKLDLVLSFCFLPPTIALVVLPTVVNLLEFLNDTLQ